MAVRKVVIGLMLLTATLSADIPRHELRGRVWIDFAESGIYVRVDLASDVQPDGVIDAELFLMTRETFLGLDTIELPSATIWTTSRSVVVADNSGRRILRLIVPVSVASLVDSDSDGPVDRDDSPGLELRKRDEAYVGYGLRYAIVTVTRDEILADSSWRNQPTSNASCEAGAACGALSCTVSCGDPNRSCNVTCQSGYSACCWCGGANNKLPLCTCLQCS